MKNSVCIDSDTSLICLDKNCIREVFAYKNKLIVYIDNLKLEYTLESHQDALKAVEAVEDTDDGSIICPSNLSKSYNRF